MMTNPYNDPLLRSHAVHNPYHSAAVSGSGSSSSNSREVDVCMRDGLVYAGPITEVHNMQYRQDPDSYKRPDISLATYLRHLATQNVNDLMIDVQQPRLEAGIHGVYAPFTAEEADELFLQLVGELSSYTDALRDQTQDLQLTLISRVPNFWEEFSKRNIARELAFCGIELHYGYVMNREMENPFLEREFQECKENGSMIFSAQNPILEFSQGVKRTRLMQYRQMAEAAGVNFSQLEFYHIRTHNDYALLRRVFPECRLIVDSTVFSEWNEIRQERIYRDRRGAA